jgi:hypothetical protein
MGRPRKTGRVRRPAWTESVYIKTPGVNRERRTLIKYGSGEMGCPDRFKKRFGLFNVR